MPIIHQLNTSQTICPRIKDTGLERGKAELHEPSCYTMHDYLSCLLVTSIIPFSCFQMYMGTPILSSTKH